MSRRRSAPGPGRPRAAGTVAGRLAAALLATVLLAATLLVAPAARAEPGGGAPGRPGGPPRGQRSEVLLRPTTTITPPVGCNVLTPGMNGTKVKLVQRRLGLPGSAWETMDATTISAVRSFQRAHGLSADGVVGPATWAAMGFTGDFCAPDHFTEPVVLPLSATSVQRREQLIAYMLARRGREYVWGGAGPQWYDCSGLILQGLYTAGLDPQPITVVLHAQPTYRSSIELYEHPFLRHVPLSQVQRGDLVFWRSRTTGRVNHVAVALGGDTVVEAVEPVVHTASLSATRRTQTVTPTVVRVFP